MKRKLQIAFILVILSVFALPILKFNTNKTVSEKEKRTLASKPILKTDGRLNTNFFNDSSSYFNDHFGFREILISLNKKLNLMLNANSIIFNDCVVQGKDGWWFYISKIDGNNLSDFYKTNLLDKEELETFRNNVEKTSEWCKSQGIPFLFVICPNKHSVYEEFYQFERPEGITRTDQLTKIFDSLKVPYVFPRDFLISKKAEYDLPLYHECGTHWTSLGAYLAATRINDMVKTFLPTFDFPEINYKIKDVQKTDFDSILNMLGLESDYEKSTTITLEPENSNFSDLYTYLKNADRNGVHTKGADEKLPRALIFRDSFFIALEPFVSPMFSEAEYKWKQFQEEDKEYVLQYKPDIIIFEAVERYAPKIVN